MCMASIRLPADEKYSAQLSALRSLILGYLLPRFIPACKFCQRDYSPEDFESSKPCCFNQGSCSEASASRKTGDDVDKVWQRWKTQNLDLKMKLLNSQSWFKAVNIAHLPIALSIRQSSANWSCKMFPTCHYI